MEEAPMENNPILSSRDDFLKKTVPFFETIFSRALEEGQGEIEIRIFPKDQPPSQYFFDSPTKAAETAYGLGNSGLDIYFGVNPRIGKKGRKENIRALVAFHAELDYGPVGHKKPPIHETRETALKAIREYPLNPTLIVHSGGGFHCYWVLKDPVKVEEAGVDTLESINKELSIELGGDAGTQNLDRVLRAPGTYNFKDPGNPRKVEIISDSGPKYGRDSFDYLIAPVKNEKEKSQQIPESNSPNVQKGITWNKSIEDLPVSGRIKSLILHGNDGTYISRSEADMAVITALVNKGVDKGAIGEIFRDPKYRIGEKYRQHNAPDKYLDHNIAKASEHSHLTEEEMINPLFISGSLHKRDKQYHLNVVKFQEYMVKKYRLKILEKENAIFRYNGKCYEHCSEEFLNHLCQKELKDHRKLFTKSLLKDFIHYAIGDKLVDSEKARRDEVNHLTLQNGLYKLGDGKLVPHNPNIFTTNLLPYDYDPHGRCPRFLRYLEEVFLGDRETIDFVQEAVGYAFHKAIPMPAIFLLIGTGSNGKSVFINTLTNLVGEENTCSVSLNSLTNEYYILGLFGKMINVSSETPHHRRINTDLIKAVVGGDWITGRSPYKQPMKFRPYAKHYLAMNETPSISDTSHGMWRRIYVVEFPRTFSEDEMDVDLAEKLSKELSGVFNWAMEGYNRLRTSGFRFQEARTMKLAKQRFKNETSSVLAFISERLAKSAVHDDRVKFSSVYQQYLDFCQAEEYDNPESKGAFKKNLVNAGFAVRKSSRDGNQIHVFGVKIVNTDPIPI
jgi:putative DNA primase/helicase